MPEIPKGELDKVFREGADQYDFQFKPEAWDHMETLLNRDRRRRKVFWWWLGVLGLLVLIFSFGLFSYRIETSVQDQILKHSTEEAVATAVSPKTDSQADSSNTRPIPGILQVNNVPTEPVQVPQLVAPREQISSERPFIQKIPKIAAAEELAQSELPELPTAMPPVPDRVSNSKPATDQLTDTQEIPSSVGEKRMEEWFLEPLERTKSYLPIAAYSSNDTLRPIVQRGNNKINSSTSKFIFGANLSPELVSVGFDHFSRLGVKAGLLVEYQYFRRLGLSMGLNFLRKSYAAAKGEYHPPYGFWIRHIVPIETDGVCNILEIPVMLTYYTRGYDRAGLYGAFGASSYIMLKEKYTYHYDVPDTDLIRDWSSNQTTRHWMSMLNFSLGYKGPLSEKLSYRLGLFGQTPLTGVGHGKVDLNSLGIDFTLIFSTTKSR